jgi:hypothetical protein
MVRANRVTLARLAGSEPLARAAAGHGQVRTVPDERPRAEFPDERVAPTTERSVLRQASMRRWFYLSVVIAVGCASVAVPNRPVGLQATDAGGDDDGASVGALDPPSDSLDGDAAASTSVGSQLSADDGTSSPVVDSAAVEAANETILTMTTPPFDTSDGGVCAGPLVPGELVIVELMIESVAGTGDHGEWLEVQSTSSCALDLRGLHGEAPNGNKLRTFQIGDDLWIPAYGTFVVADSSDPAINHGLPAPLVAWSGQPGDVLRNKGGTVNLLMNGLIIDSVTYPSMTLEVGATLAFPSDCDPARRTDWTAWQTSTSSWFPGFRGTPNAPNSDVQCP